MNQESRMLQSPINYNNDNLYPIAHSEPDTSSYSIRIASYTRTNDYWP
jgi:hypothetical protein